MAGHLGEIDKTLLTPRQLGLIEESRGLLLAVANGRDCREGRRIRECIIEVLSLFASPETTYEQIPPPKRHAIDELCGVLRRVTAIGVALEPSAERTNHLKSRMRT